jgi:3',5'-cyclic AMP phosphodiesterase CpdA
MTLVIAHLSDIHFGGENTAAVAATREWIGACNPDLVIITGDITQQGDESEFATARAWVESLQREVLVTPGNHDTPYFDPVKRLFAPWARYRRHFGRGSPGGLTLRPGLAVRSLNSARGFQPRLNWSKGQVSHSQTRSSVKALDRAPAGAVRILACHHPLVEMLGGPMTGRVWGGARAAKAFSEAGIDLVLTGHIHAPFALAYPYGDGKTYAVGASTLSLRERKVPPGFNRIEIDDDGFTIKGLGWTGSHFEPWRTWHLTRRGTPHP